VKPVEIPTYETPDPYLRPVSGSPVAQEAWDRMTGLEVMKSLAGGDLPAPPISHLTGLRPTEVSEGTATFTLPTSPWLTSPLGTVQGGATALLADTVLATAVQTTLPARTVYAPLDLKVNYLRPVFADGRDLVGTATVAHKGRTLAVANAEIFNADGKKVAVAAGTALIREGQPWQAEEPTAGSEAG
jgi:acyl-CoA thioesterase